MEYTTKDSGERVEWETGSKRDTNEGKPRYDLIGTVGLSKYLDSLDFTVWETQEATGLNVLVDLPMMRKTDRDDCVTRVVNIVFALMEGLDEIPSYIPVEGLKRLAGLMQRGAEKYDEHNWTKGQPTSRSYESALRHYLQFLEGDTEEDHLAGVLFNLFSLQHVWYKISLGELPHSLDDMYTL